MLDFQKMVRERLRDCGLSPAREWEIIDELSQHLRDRYESLVSSGATQEEADRAIVAELEGRDLASDLREIEQRWKEPVSLGASKNTRLWSGLWQDLRYAVRTLRLNRGFTTVCVLSLALGIGANTAIFQLIDAVRMRTLPVEHPEELAVIRPTDFHVTGRHRGHFGYVTNAMWEQIRAQQQGFSGVFAFGNDDFNLATSGQVRYAQGLWVSGEFFDVLGVQPVLGRVFHHPDDHPGCGAPGVVLSYAFWQSEFGGQASAIGKTVELESSSVPGAWRDAREFQRRGCWTQLRCRGADLLGAHDRRRNQHLCIAARMVARSHGSLKTGLDAREGVGATGEHLARDYAGHFAARLSGGRKKRLPAEKAECISRKHGPVQPPARV
jgi:hypothetical protein